MKPIQNPLPPAIGPGSDADAVANLQDVLLFLLEKGRLHLSEDERRALLIDREAQVYQDGTSRAVMAFREQFHLEPGEIVDEPTANALNEVLSTTMREDGSFETPPVENAPRLLSLGSRGEDVRALQEGLLKAGLAVPEQERREQLFGVGTREAVLTLQARHGLRNTGVFDEATRHALANALDVASGPKHRVEGRILFDHGLPAGGVPILLYHRRFGGADYLGRTETDAQGFYAIPYPADGGTANLEVRAVDARGNEVPLSATKFNAGRQEVLNLVAPARVSVNTATGTILLDTFRLQAPEYQRLMNDLARQIGAQGQLGAAREDKERRDLTLLRQATGWDARLIALAAIAERLNAESHIPREAVYGLLRAGLPTDKQAFARVSVEEVKIALDKAQDAGIIRLDEKQMAEARAAFETFARETLRSAVAPGALSSFGDLLGRSGLSDDERRQFEDIYFAHRGPAHELWEKAQAAGLPVAKINGLRLQGKLAYLTRDNAELTEQLQQEIGLPDHLGRLVEMDLYRKEDWKRRLYAMAGVDKEAGKDEKLNKETGALDAMAGIDEALEKLIPPAYGGDTTADRLDAYAADLARQVRLSFPTKVIGRMIVNNELTLGAAHAEVKQSVTTFLRNAEPLGFALGGTPLDAFVTQNKEKVLAGIDEGQRELMMQGVRRLDRLYQITPGDESLQELSKLGFDSAYDVAAFTEDEFVARYGGRFSSEEAKLIVRKAQQVTTVAYSLLTAAKQLDSAPAVYALSPSTEQRENAKKELIKHYPSMESLFGSLDYCECEHCRSVLSPASYLVDLLEFLNPDGEHWLRFLKKWESEHGGEPYDGSKYGYQKPFDALIERRPDLPHLPLTCENTHTALPYIDVVNEVLEYVVAKEKLEAEAAQDTGTATTPELLAEPQNILPEAYAELKDSRYPLTLPFDLWLETVRRFVEHFETPLWRVLEVFRPSDDLFAPDANPKPYYRAAIFAEYLGISPSECALFTDSNPLATWHVLYGYTSEPEALCDVGRLTAVGAAVCGHPGPDGNPLHRVPGLPNARVLARRLGISYHELAEIVQDAFVNPGLHQLGILWTLRLGVHAVVDYLENRTHPEFAAEKQAFEERLEALDRAYGQQPGFALAQIEALAASADYKTTLLPRDRDTSGKCNFDQTWLEFTDGTPADALAFLRMNLFVRLWKHLGWTIEETGRALDVFVPRNSLPLTGANFGAAVQTAIIYLSHLKALDARVQAGTHSRLKLLTLWADIATTGNTPLYAQLFLTRSMLKNNPVFDHPLGKYLQYFDAVDHEHPYKPFYWDPTQPEDPATGNVSLKSHLLAVQGALTVTSEEIGRILADAKGKPFEEAAEILEKEPLTLVTVSLIYRYGLLARALKLSVRELIALKQLSGRDPFTQLHSEPLADTPVGVEPAKKAIDFDYLFSQTLRFVEVVEEVKDSGLQIDDLEYLLRHCFDETGKYRPDREGTLALLKTLAEGVRAIRAEHAVPDDPGAMSDEVLRQKLGLALPSDVVDTFLAMINRTVEFTATRPGVKLEHELKPATFADEPRIRQVSYKEKPHEEQKLTLRAVLFADQKTQLETRFDSVLTAAQKPVFADLLDDIQSKGSEFFGKYLLKFFDDFSHLFAIGSAGLADPELQTKFLWVFKSQLDHFAPNVLTDALLTKNLGSVLPSGVAGTFLKMWAGEIEYTAVQQDVEPANQLDPNAFTEPYIKQVEYDEEHKTQTLIFQGVLLDPQSAELKAKYPSPVFARLLDDVQNQARGFCEEHLLDFLTIDDFGQLFKPIPANLTEAEKEDRRREKRAKLEDALLLYIMAVDPKILTKDLFQKTLDLIFASHAGTFLKMWAGEIEYTAVQQDVKPANKLDQTVFTEPCIKQVKYDEVDKTQTLIFQGVLLDPQSVELKAKYPSPVFARLLDDVQNQARGFYEKNLSGVFADGTFCMLFTAVSAGLNDTLKQSLTRQHRTNLAKAFLPYLQQQSIRQFIVQTITAHLGSNQVLVEALLTDRRLLGDPQSLLEAFTATGERGVSAAFINSDGTSQATGPLVTSADTALKDKKDKGGNPLNPANSAQFKGYLEVPTPGAYRFYVELEKQNAVAELRFDHLPQPLYLSDTAATDNAVLGDKPNEYLELRPGTPYRFSLNLRDLNGGEARLLVQGETLPKGSLAQLTLYPLTAVERAEGALVLLTKALQLVQSLGLSEREIRYLLTNAEAFDGLSLSKLPVATSDDSADSAKALFGQFLRLAGYFRLKRDLAGGTDDLIGIFEANGTTDKDKLDKRVYPLIVKLTRRDETTVKASAEGLFTAPDFASEKPLQRLWEALQVVERLGVPVASLLEWTRIVSPTPTPEQPFAIARDLRNTLKARFEPETWQRVAQPIFDKLRQRQRDALVAHVMHQHGFDRMEQLYEYFLIDPGMEPVVQTSRVRLAISSVQTFVQRCLLNLEPKVHPSAINAQHWQWMKRYRVWEANRKLFLFPENWLEPEFRDDKTHLFRELEGALLQGDVSNDLAEDAFYRYLKELDTLARLKMVTMYLEEKPDILHLIGRTVNPPLKYFYRRYSNQMWTPWEPVTADIEGDHVVAVMWRARLHLFWLTFLEKPKDTTEGKPVKLDINDLQIPTDMPRDVEIQLNWSEYFQGEWTTREAGGFDDPLPLPNTVRPFNPSDVFIHVSKVYEGVEERAVEIDLMGPFSGRFRVVSKNSPPSFSSPVNPPDIRPLAWEFMYSDSGAPHVRHATTLRGTEPLTVSFIKDTTTVTSSDTGSGSHSVSGPQYSPSGLKEILRVGVNHTLLPCGNPESLPANWLAAFGGGLSPEENNSVRFEVELKILSRQFFYEDRDSPFTFFVEPTLTETPINKWESYWQDEDWGDVPPVVRVLYRSEPHPPSMRIPPPEEPLALFTVRPSEDWMTSPDTTIQYGESVIGADGRIDDAALALAVSAADFANRSMGTSKEPLNYDQHN